MDRSGAPLLLPILRSRQQGEVLAWLLDDPQQEISVSALARTLRIPQPSVFREIVRAESAGIVKSHLVGRTRVVSANTSSPYYSALREVLVRAFGVPHYLGRALTKVRGIDRAFVFGSWASRFAGQPGVRAVGDIDVLVLGNPDADDVYRRLAEVGTDLGYEIQATIRPVNWIESGKGSFHDTVMSRPLVQIILSDYRTNLDAAAQA